MPQLAAQKLPGCLDTSSESSEPVSLVCVKHQHRAARHIVCHFKIWHALLGQTWSSDPAGCSWWCPPSSLRLQPPGTLSALTGRQHVLLQQHPFIPLTLLAAPADAACLPVQVCTGPIWNQPLGPGLGEGPHQP